jgi:hypothetical protein
VNLKSLYRLAGSQPLQKIDARIVRPICLVLGVDLSELITLEKPQARMFPAGFPGGFKSRNSL